MSCDAKVNAAGGRRDQEADLEGARAARGPAGRVCDWDGQRPQQPHQHDQWTPQQLAICHRGWRRRWAGMPQPSMQRRSGITTRLHQLCRVLREQIVNTSNVSCVFLITFPASCLWPACSVFGPVMQERHHALLPLHQAYCLLQGWTPPGMLHQPMAQQRHESVAMALFCFLGVRTGQ